MSDLVVREGFYYQKFTDVPFTGEIDEGLERGNFKNGGQEGPWIVYWENGQLHFKGERKKDREEGPWIIYNENGQLYSKGEYKNGKMEGTWVFYNEDGTKRMSEVKVGTRIFDEGSGVYHRGKKVSD